MLTDQEYSCWYVRTYVCVIRISMYTNDLSNSGLEPTLQTTSWLIHTLAIFNPSSDNTDAHPMNTPTYTHCVLPPHQNVCSQLCIHTYIHTYIRIYTHLHMHIHVQTMHPLPPSLSHLLMMACLGRLVSISRISLMVKMQWLRLDDWLSRVLPMRRLCWPYCTSSLASSTLVTCTSFKPAGEGLVVVNK